MRRATPSFLVCFIVCFTVCGIVCTYGVPSFAREQVQANIFGEMNPTPSTRHSTHNTIHNIRATVEQLETLFVTPKRLATVYRLRSDNGQALSAVAWGGRYEGRVQKMFGVPLLRAHENCRVTLETLPQPGRLLHGERFHYVLRDAQRCRELK